MNRLPLLVAVASLFVLAPAVDAGGRIGHRLYRHRNGYLYGQSRPLGESRPAVTREAGGYGEGTGGDAADDDRWDQDYRRDRLLEYASDVDVTWRGIVPTNARPYDAGWKLIAEGEPVRALGRFAVARLRAPGDVEAHLGYAIAAAALGDAVTANAALARAVDLDPRAMSQLPAHAKLAHVVDDLVRQLESGDRHARQVAAMLAGATESVPPDAIARHPDATPCVLLVLR